MIQQFLQVVNSFLAIKLKFCDFFSILQNILQLSQNNIATSTNLHIYKVPPCTQDLIMKLSDFDETAFVFVKFNRYFEFRTCNSVIFYT